MRDKGKRGAEPEERRAVLMGDQKTEALAGAGGGATRSAALATVVGPRAEASGSAISARAVTRYERYAKAGFDRVAGVVLAVVAIPIVLVIALLIRVKLGKGVIYKQQRVGRHGKPFTMYKFRTMAPDRRQAAQPFAGPDRRVCHKRDDDPRHTPLGRFLRRASLDELPQILNVIRGDMSLVGPRPELPHIVQRYEPWQHARHAVKPGITGFWQLSGRAGGLAYEGVELDLDYLGNLSFSTDLWVLLRTVPVALSRTGR